MSKISPFPRAVKSGAPTGNTGSRGFFSWLARAQPRVYSATMTRLGRPGLSGLGLIDTTSAVGVAVSSEPMQKSTADKIKDVVMGISQAYLTARQLEAQRKVMDMQLKRAEQGLPPLNLNMADYGLTGPQVSVGMSQDTKNLLMIGGAVLAAVYLVPKFFKR